METYKGNLGEEPELHESLHEGVVYRKWDDGRGPLRYPQYVLTRVELAEFFQGSNMLVDRWRQQGCPFYQPPSGEIGSTYKFYLPDVVDWRTCIGYLKYNKTALRLQKEAKDGTSDPTTSPKGRMAMAKARMAELQLEEKQGRLLPLEIVLLTWQEILAVLKSRAQSCGPALAVQLGGRSMPAAQVEKIISGEMAAMLNEVSNASLPPKLRDALANLDGGAETAAPADDSRVGRGQAQA